MTPGPPARDPVTTMRSPHGTASTTVSIETWRLSPAAPLASTLHDPTRPLFGSRAKTWSRSPSGAATTGGCASIGSGFCSETGSSCMRLGRRRAEVLAEIVGQRDVDRLVCRDDLGEGLDHPREQEVQLLTLGQLEKGRRDGDRRARPWLPAVQPRGGLLHFHLAAEPPKEELEAVIDPRDHLLLSQ